MSVLKKPVLVLLCLVLLLVTAGSTGCSWQNNYSIKVTPNGEDWIIQAYGEDYREPGATAVLHTEGGEEVSLPVTVESTVLPDKVGNYLVRYTAQYQNCKGTAYRRVEVVDTTPPEFKLVAQPGSFTLPNDVYQEEGFSAFDDYDGDLTHKVTRTQTEHAVIYSVTDSSGNMATVTRQIRYDDPILPELEIKGENMMILCVGDQYTEPGYVATDNCDGDITSQVSVTGEVNTAKVGRYILTYSVKDNYENTVTATRTVFVKDAKVDKINDPEGSGKVIYLTFDDGPGPDTARLLDVLMKYNVQATFFVVKTSYIATIRRAAAEGHTVAIHTATHRFKDVYDSEEAYFDDVYDMQKTIESYTGQTPMLLRFPGGSSNTVSRFNEGIMTRLTKLVEDVGFTYFDWNVDSKDAGGAKTAEQVYQNVINGVEKRQPAVVLMHDIKGYSVDAVEQIIVWGLENGYTFLPLTESSPTCHHNVNN